MTQWHPIFDYQLRAALKDYYEVQTNVPVGDLPREADIVLVRRTTTSKPPFRTLWKNLTRWNVLEFKGRSESARVNDIDLLLEVGLGILRRLREEQPTTKIARRDVSFWYLANHLGKRFLRDVVELTGDLESMGPGLWRGHVVGRPIWLVSNSDVPVDWETAPVRMVSEQTVEQTLELASIVATSDELWRDYAPLIGKFYPDLQKELNVMAAKKGRGEINWSDLLRKNVEVLTKKELIESGAAQAIIDKVGMDEILAALTPQQRREVAKRMKDE